MDKTITIAGKSVPLRKTGGTILRYKRQFGREFLSDLKKIADLRARMTPELTKEENTQIVLSAETEWLYDVIFIMAQQADPTITDELEWLDRFDDFNVWQVFDQVMPLLLAEAKVAPKNV